MPYATRGCSIDLSALGLIAPARSNKTPPTPSASTSDHPPSKRVKRSHTLDSSSSITALASTTLPARPRARKASSTSERHAVVSTAASQPILSTPPPSPKDKDATTRFRTIDKQGISDEIVVAVLEQLETTGNRPHLIKELVAVLTNILPVVAGSQNPTAIISSRLTNYLKRPWTALAPCPLAKEQVTVHPRRVYYFLTTIPRQQIPEYAPDYNPQLVNRHIISPSISSGPDEEVELHRQSREDLSPSPEFEIRNDLLASHNIAEVHFDSADFPLNLDDDDHNESSAPTQRAPEPLEHDEREFSRMAGAMRQRQESDMAEARAASPTSIDMKQNEDDKTDFPTLHESPDEMSAHDIEELSYLRDHEAAVALFGGHAHHSHAVNDFASSPMLKPVCHKDKEMTSPRKTYFSPLLVDVTGKGGEYGDFGFGSWGELKSPEDMELAELDDLLGGC